MENTLTNGGKQEPLPKPDASNFLLVSLLKQMLGDERWTWLIALFANGRAAR